MSDVSDAPDVAETPEASVGSEDTTAVSNDPSFDAADFMRKARRWFHKDREHTKKWRDKAEESYAFVAGDQWDENDARTLKDALRPVITFNRVDPLIRSVSGEQINNAQEVRYMPRQLGDVKVSDDLTSVAEWFRDQCDADDEESDAFWDAAVCGIGVTDTLVNLDDDPSEPMPEVQRIDPLEKFWDADARKRNLSDRRRDWWVRKVSREAARNMFPDAADSDLNASWAAGDDDDDTKVADQAAVKYQEDEDKERGDGFGGEEQITLVQLQWWEKEAYYRIVDPVTQQSTDLPVDQYNRLNERMKKLSAPLQGVRLERKVYQQAFLGRTVLKVGKSPCADAFSANYITGFRDRNNGTFYGLVEAMKDPQRWANKWLSQTLHIMNVNAKGGVMIEEGAVGDKRKFEESFAKPQDITWVPEGSLSSPSGAKIQPKPGATFPQGFYQLMTFAVSSVRDVAGINLEMLGMREADQAASLEYQRRQAGVAILAPLFRAMRRYHRNQGRVLLYYIQNVLNPAQLVKIVGNDGNPQFQPLQTVLAIKGASAKYDIIVDEGPTSPNQKERVWALAQTLFPTLPPPVQMALLEYSPLPASVIEKIKAAANTPQAQMGAQMAQLQGMLLEAKVLLVKAQAGKMQADGAKAMASALESLGPDQSQNGAGAPQKPPSVMINFKDMPPEAQSQALAEAGIFIQPAVLAIHAANQAQSASGADPQKTATDAQVKLTGIAADLQAQREKTAADVAVNHAWMQTDAAVKASQAQTNARAQVAKALVGSRSPNTGMTPHG